MSLFFTSLYFKLDILIPGFDSFMSLCCWNFDTWIVIFRCVITFAYNISLILSLHTNRLWAVNFAFYSWLNKIDLIQSQILFSIKHNIKPLFLTNTKGEDPSSIALPESSNNRSWGTRLGSAVCSSFRF